MGVSTECHGLMETEGELGRGDGRPYGRLIRDAGLEAS